MSIDDVCQHIIIILVFTPPSPSNCWLAFFLSLSLIAMHLRGSSNKHSAVSERWAWVVPETVTTPIARQHMLTAYGLVDDLATICHNKHAVNVQQSSGTSKSLAVSGDDLNCSLA